MKIRAITAIRMLFLVVAAATLVGCLDVVPPGHPPVGIGIPSWSPDGERIVFALQGEGDPSRIYVIDADGGGLDRLTDFAATCPAWSPDGRRIALVGTTDAPYGRSWLVAMNADGSGAKRIYRTASYADIGCPAWSPEGERLAFIDDYKITLIGRDGRTAWRIAAPAQDVFDLLAWSPNGRSIAYTQWNARRNDTTSTSSRRTERRSRAFSSERRTPRYGRLTVSPSRICIRVRVERLTTSTSFGWTAGRGWSHRGSCLPHRGRRMGVSWPSPEGLRAYSSPLPAVVARGGFLLTWRGSPLTPSPSLLSSLPGRRMKNGSRTSRPMRSTSPKSTAATCAGSPTLTTLDDGLGS